MPTNSAPAGSPIADRWSSIAEAAEQTGLSKDTLRYYERAGLVQAVDRSSGGQRRYAAEDLEWLRFLLRLRATGMPIAQMQRFAALRQRGDPTVADRLQVLKDHQLDLDRRIAELRTHRGALASKITHYEDLLLQAGTDAV